MAQEQYEANRNYGIQILGFRICMVKTSIFSKLSRTTIGMEGFQTDLMQPQNQEITIAYFESRIAVLEGLKRSNITEDTLVLSKKTDGYERGIKDYLQTEQIQIPSLYQLGKKYDSFSEISEYRNTIHEKVDTILKGTENDPYGRAQFDNLISRLSQTYQEVGYNIKLKEK